MSYLIRLDDGDMQLIDISLATHNRHIQAFIAKMQATIAAARAPSGGGEPAEADGDQLAAHRTPAAGDQNGAAEDPFGPAGRAHTPNLPQGECQ